MKIVSHYLESITGIEIFPLISFMIFFLFFLAVTIYVIKLDKSFIRKMSDMPLSSDQHENIDDENFR